MVLTSIKIARKRRIQLKKGIVRPSPMRQHKKYSITEIRLGIVGPISVLLPSFLYRNKDKPGDPNRSISAIIQPLADGMQIDIEVQLNNQYNMDKRTLFYWGKLFLEGIKQGEDYIKLSKVITINILDFDYLDIAKFHSTYHLWEDNEADYLLTDLIEVHFIELPKFRRFDKKDLRGNPLHRWLKFFDKMLSEEELKELTEMDSAIKRAEKKLEYLSSDEETLASCTGRVRIRLTNAPI